MNSKLDCWFSIIKEINICFLLSNAVIFYDMGMDVTAFNDFVERFFFQGGIIIQHTSLKKNKYWLHRFGFILVFLFSTQGQKDAYRFKYIHSLLIRDAEGSMVSYNLTRPRCIKILSLIMIESRW